MIVFAIFVSGVVLFFLYPDVFCDWLNKILEKGGKFKW